MRVLIIDDDVVARELLTSTLKLAGHEVFELNSAIGATRAIAQYEIDVAVVDVMLPDIRGDKLAQVLRQNPRGASLGIVLVSGCPVEELRALADSSQADIALQKSDIRLGLAPAVKVAWHRRSRASRAG